jgi:hypothetical protein
MERIKMPQFKNPDKNHKNPYVRYSTFSVEMVKSEKYPHLVEVTRSPKWARSIVGKRYVSYHHAMIAIDTLRMEYMIDKSKSKVVEELEREGFDSDMALEALSNDSFLNFM